MMFLATCVAMAAALNLAAAEPETGEAGAGRFLAFVLPPGDVREHRVVLDLETALVVRTGSEELERRTSSTVSFDVRSLGLRRMSAERTVVEFTVRGFGLRVLTRAGESTVEVVMDDEGMTLRRPGSPARRVPWANVPRGRGGELGELIGRPMVCTIDQHAGAVTIDGQMEPWSRVLDSLDLTPLIVPLVPLPASEEEPETTWTVDETASVRLSHPWGGLRLATRTAVTLEGFEQADGATVARLAFKRVSTPAEETPRFTYELAIEGVLRVGLDGAVVGGEADVRIAASTLVIDRRYELAGEGTLRFNPPDEAHDQ